MGIQESPTDKYEKTNRIYVGRLAKFKKIQNVFVFQICHNGYIIFRKIETQKAFAHRENYRLLLPQ